MSREFVIYNGVRMIKGWPEKIQAAQLPTTYAIGGSITRQIMRGLLGGILGGRRR